MSRDDREFEHFTQVDIEDLEGQTIQNRGIQKELFDMDPSKIHAMVGIVIERPQPSEEYPDKKYTASKVFASGEPLQILEALEQLNKQILGQIAKHKHKLTK